MTDSAKRPRVVIADDFSAVIDAVERYLQGSCEIVGKASNGLELVECATGLRPDLLITDVSMPEQSGVQALRRLRELNIEISAIVLTVHEDEDLLQEVLALGVRGFVLKSRIASDLASAVRYVLAGKQFISKRIDQGLQSPGQE